MATFAKKTVYHSALRSAGPLTIRLTSEIRNSQYRNRPPYVEFEVKGDPSRYQYQVENDRVAETLRSVPVGQWVEIQADGTKDSAKIDVTFLRNQPVENGNGRQSNGNGAAPARSAAEEVGSSLAEVLWRCLKVSVALNKKFEEEFGRPMTENDRAIAIALAIEVHKGNLLPLV